LSKIGELNALLLLPEMRRIFCLKIGERFGVHLFLATLCFRYQFSSGDNDDHQNQVEEAAYWATRWAATGTAWEMRAAACAAFTERAGVYNSRLSIGRWGRKNLALQ
jgi:hypothetical protein